MARASAARAPAADTRAPGEVPALRCGTATHPGRVRERNEDRVHADPGRGILMVVDGIGGEAGGEAAAETAVEVMRRRLERRTGDPEERLREAITVANNEIVALARRRPEWSGMGCVTTVAIVEDGQVTVGHVGDSRLYRLHGGAIEKATRDHSPVGEREDKGELAEREAMAHPRRNEVYRSVGGEERTPFDDGFVDVVRFPFAAGDAVLLCSDGLSDLVPSDRIAAIAREHARDPEAVAARLVDAALAAGGKDNVSVVFAAGRRFAAEWPAARERGPRAPLPATRDGEAVSGATAGAAFSWPAFAWGAAAGVALAGLVALALALWPRDAAVTPPLPVLGEARGRALRVGPGGAHRAIGDALAAARAGDTVVVAAGIYRESVRLPEGVTLAAAEPGTAVIAPAPGAAAGIVVEGIGSGAVRGVAVRGGDTGIRVSDAAVTIDDVEVAGARVAGVLVENGRGVAVRASRIHDNPGAGVAVRAGGAARLAHNRIADNGRGPAALPGVLVEGLARADLEGNVITGHGIGVRGVPRAERTAVLARNRFQGNRVDVAELGAGASR